MDQALLLFWCTFFFPLLFSQGALLWVLGILPKHRFSLTWLEKELRRLLYVSFMISLNMYALPRLPRLPPTLFSVLSFPNLVLEYETSKLSEDIKGHLVWWSPN